MSLDQFEALMRLLVEAGRVTKRGQRYFPAAVHTRGASHA